MPLQAALYAARALARDERRLAQLRRAAPHFRIAAGTPNSPAR
jgi:hypothetical protein